MKNLLIIIFIAVIFLAGCRTQIKYAIEIDSISSPAAESKKTYILLSGVKEINKTDLQFIEYANYVDAALASRGFIKAQDKEKADVAIFLIYGIGNPQENTYNYSLPIIGQTGVSSSTTYGNINTFGNTSTYSGSTFYTPTYGVTGHVPVSRSYVTYFRYLILDAIDLDSYKQTQQMNQLWQTTVTSTGSSGDLRIVLPILVAASQKYMGVNTGKKIYIKLSRDRVVEIKKLNEQIKSSSGSSSSHTGQSTNE